MHPRKSLDHDNSKERGDSVAMGSRAHYRCILFPDFVTGDSMRSLLKLQASGPCGGPCLRGGNCASLHPGIRSNSRTPS